MKASLHDSPQNCKCDVIHCVPCSGAGFHELRCVNTKVRSKFGMFHAASEVSSMVDLVDVASVLAQAFQSPGGQVSISQLKWYL